MKINWISSAQKAIDPISYQAVSSLSLSTLVRSFIRSFVRSFFFYSFFVVCVRQFVLYSQFCALLLLHFCFCLSSSHFLSLSLLIICYRCLSSFLLVSSALRLLCFKCWCRFGMYNNSLCTLNAAYRLHYLCFNAFQSNASKMLGFCPTMPNGKIVVWVNALIFFFTLSRSLSLFLLLPVFLFLSVSVS